MKYVTDSNLVEDRQGDEMEERKKTVKEKWKLSTRNAMTCGNITAYFEDSQAELAEWATGVRSWWQISSALALYRTISLFECGLSTSRLDFYKMNWYVQLEHKETKQILGLGEWKGAFKIFTGFSRDKDLESYPLFKTDAEELLTLLVAPDLTIGYDGTVAGTVA